MEFRDYAATETSALLGRLLAAQAADAVHQLRAVRDAIDAAARAAEAASAAAPGAVEQDVAELAARLGDAVGAERQRIEQSAQAGIDAARAELHTQITAREQLETSLTDAAAREAQLRAALQQESERAESADRDLDATIDAHKQVDAARIEAETALKQETAARAAVETELADLRSLLESTRAQASRIAEQLEAESAQTAVLNAERDATTAEMTALAAQLAVATGEVSRLSGSLDAAFAQDAQNQQQLEAGAAQAAHMATQLEAAASQCDDLNAQLEAAAAQHAEFAARIDVVAAERDGLRAELESAHANGARLQFELDAHQESARLLEGRLADSLRTEASVLDQATSAGAELEAARAAAIASAEQAARLATLMEASLQALDDLGHASTMADLLGALATQLTIAFPRSAIFRVKGNHLEGEHQRGFDMTADVAKLVLPLTLESLVTRAAVSGASTRLSAGGENQHAPFGGEPAQALALPIAFQGDTLAVAYVESDDEADMTLEAGERFATLLARHTAVLVTRLSQELKMLAELRDYATMLLQEADQMYAADLEAGRSEADRGRRLQETIDCARQLYAQRAALEGSAAAALLDEQIALQSGNDTPFAKELRVVTGQGEPAQARRTAAS